MKEKADLLRVMTKGDSRLRSVLAMFTDELKENMRSTGTERRARKEKRLRNPIPEWFKHWFDLTHPREDASYTKGRYTTTRKVCRQTVPQSWY